MRILFKRRTCDVPATFLWRICIGMKFHFRMYGVSKRMCYLRVAYVHATRNVPVTYTFPRRMHYVPFLSAAYLLCNKCVLLTVRTERLRSEVEDTTEDFKII